MSNGAVEMLSKKMCLSGLPVEVFVDLPLVGEPHHTTDDARVFGGPPLVAHLRPAVLVAHLHHALCYRQPALSTDDHRTQAHFFDVVFIHIHLHA